MKNLLLKVKSFFKSLGSKLLEILAGKSPELPAPQPDPPPPKVAPIQAKEIVPDISLNLQNLENLAPKPRRSRRPQKGKPRRGKNRFPIKSK